MKNSYYNKSNTDLHFQHCWFGPEFEGTSPTTQNTKIQQLLQTKACNSCATKSFHHRSAKKRRSERDISLLAVCAWKTHTHPEHRWHDDQLKGSMSSSVCHVAIETGERFCRFARIWKRSGGPRFCIPLKLVRSEGYVVIFKEITRAAAIWLEPPYRIKGCEGPRAQVLIRLV